ncbi:PAS domain S-box protein [Lutibacter sp.]|uniref:PAS domain S-box protein n=1 Tax=Lutibacter sp. TaxID=1925666 RepID=UPI001A2A4D4F|nr:PAS domain S-box protein [Lutibacter sp.]MBI9040668.1 PAS domain S-box protein [Lutibacter sp.]
MAHKLDQEVLEKDLTKIELLEVLKTQNKNINLLEKEYAKYKNWFENSIDGFYRSSLEGHFIDINLSLVKMLGYNSKEELLKVNIKSQIYLNSDEREAVIKQNENDSRKVHSIRKKDGTSIWVEDYVRKVYDDNGNLLFFEGIIRNVSEIVKAKKIQKVLLKISQQGYKSEHLKDLNEFIRIELGKLLDTTNFYIAFYNEQEQTLNIPFMTGEDFEGDFPAEKSMTGFLIKKNEPVLIKSQEFEKLIETGEIELLGGFPKVWLGVPLRVKNKVIGAIVVQSYDDENAYSVDDIELLNFISSQLSIIVQRKKDIQENTISKEILRKVLDNIPTKVFWKDLDSKFLGVNAASINEKQFKDENDVIGKSDFDFYDKKWAQKYRNDELEIMQSGVPKLNYIETQVVNGEERSYISSKLPFYDSNNKIIGIIGTSEDITEKLDNENKLKNITDEISLAKEVLRKVLDNIPIKVFWKNKESKFLGCNEAFLKDNSFTNEEEIIGKSDFDFNDRIDAEKYRNDDVAIILSGNPKLNYQQSYIKNGEERWTRTSKLPFFDEEKNVIGIIGTSEDITERLENEKKLKKATEEAINANLSKSTFLANMSHEIRTPMNAILGYSQLLQEDDNLTKDQQENLKTINKSGEHLLALINDILDMSKIEAGRLDVNLADFDFIELLKEVEQLFKNKAASKNLMLDFKVGLSVPKIMLADQSKIKQVIINLIGNAIKFTDNGFVQVIVETVNNQLLKVEVKDSGCGIAVDDQLAIFKPFEQAKKGGEVIGGTGLGLAISKKFSNLMKGDITIESEPNKGSSFIFTFEFQEGKSIKTLEEIRSRKVLSLVPEMQGIKVAIVDDRFENRDILYKKLHPLGFKIKMAENGSEAVELYENWKPDIVLMDVVMPVMNGVEATRRILEIANGKHDVKVFVVSASALESEQREVMDIGATVFIKKPVIFDNLIFELENKGNLKFIFKEENKNCNTQNIEVSPTDIPLMLKAKFIMAADEGDFEQLQDLLKILEKETQKTFKYIDECILEMEFENLVKWLKS